MLTVAEAAETLGISVFRTRTLIRDGVLDSSRVGPRRYVPSAAIAAYLRAKREREAQLRAAASREWDWEGNLVATLADWLKREGWREVSRSDAALREHGIDLVVSKGGRTRLIEVKGWPTRLHASGKSAGQPKASRHAMGRTYLGSLVLSAMVLRSSRPMDEVAIAVPDHTTFTSLLETIRPSLTAIGVGVYVIDQNNGVSMSLECG